MSLSRFSQDVDRQDSRRHVLTWLHRSYRLWGVIIGWSRLVLRADRLNPCALFSSSQRPIAGRTTPPANQKCPKLGSADPNRPRIANEGSLSLELRESIRGPRVQTQLI